MEPCVIYVVSYFLFTGFKVMFVDVTRTVQPLHIVEMQIFTSNFILFFEYFMVVGFYFVTGLF